MTTPGDTAHATMFAVRVDPAVHFEILEATVRDDLADVLSRSCPHGTVSCAQELGGIWRFRGPLPRSTWANLPLRERWLAAIATTAKAYLNVLRTERGIEAAAQANTAAGNT